MMHARAFAIRPSSALVYTRRSRFHAKGAPAHGGEMAAPRRDFSCRAPLRRQTGRWQNDTAGVRAVS
jgi:hypothetical protein